MIRIGPSGNSTSFYQSGREHTCEAAEWLHSFGLNAFEYSFGRGVRMSPSTAAKIKEEFTKYDINISAHAPYYINFANTDPEAIKKSFSYIHQSILAVQAMGGNRVVFHPGSECRQERGEAFANTLKNIAFLMEYLYANGLQGFILCAESMGKHGQIGTSSEIIEICKISEQIYPCFDFGHINSFTNGALKTKDDYRKILDCTRAELGDKKADNMHIHFSKIMYGKSGEIKHLTFNDEIYGPDYSPLAQLIDEYKMTPTIICESDGTMAEDAIIMKNSHNLFDKVNK